MVEIIEMMYGTVLSIPEIAHASKLGAGHGWKVKSLIGKPYRSTRFLARVGEMTNVKIVSNKAAARLELTALAAEFEKSKEPKP